MRENGDMESIHSLNAVYVCAMQWQYVVSLFLGLLPSFAPYMLTSYSLILMCSLSLLLIYNVLVLSLTLTHLQCFCSLAHSTEVS